jgi:hypothetical protein
MLLLSRLAEAYNNYQYGREVQKRLKQMRKTFPLNNDNIVYSKLTTSSNHSKSH